MKIRSSFCNASRWHKEEIQNDDLLKKILNDIRIIDDVLPQKTDDNVSAVLVKRVARYFQPFKTSCDYRMQKRIFPDE